MEVPAVTHPNWKKLICGELKCNFDFLAVKILLGRLRITYQTKPEPEVLERCIWQARELFEKNSDIPKVKNDLMKIFDEGDYK